MTDTFEHSDLQEGGVAKVQSLIEAGEEPKRVYSAIAHAAAKLSGVIGAIIYLPTDNKEEFHQCELIAQVGEAQIPEPGQTALEREARMAVHGANKLYQQNLDSTCHYTDIICLGTPIGSLGVAIAAPLSASVKDTLSALACLAGVIFERQRLSLRLRHYVDRLEVLNQLNQLIASGINLERIARSLARETAFRFAADCSLIMLLSDSGKELEIRGSYGCAPDILPPQIPLQNTILGRGLRVGGLLSIPDVNAQKNHGVDFLHSIWINCIHCATLEVQGDTLGLMLIGFRNSLILSDRESSMFEELAQGAAVAIANARSQERLTTYTEKLEDLVSQRTADLAIQTNKAEEANKAKSRFVANISHELRTPLTAIIGYASVLSDGVFGEVTEKQREALSAITRSSEHLKELIDDVLNISRIESGKEDPKPSQIPLGTLLEQIFKLMMQTALGKGLKLLPLDLDTSVLSANLWLDPRHIRQILINLLSNAIKYTKPGGTVTLRANIIGDKAKITVDDTGVGLSPAQLKTLFERYERGDNSYSKNQVGTGIGLSLTKHLVEINGGRIAVESTVDVGSSFSIFVPVADATSIIEGSAKSEESELATSGPVLSGLNILIVDDNEMTCDILATILSKVGGYPHIARSVASAKEMSQKLSLDAALIDLAMPGESGLDLIDYFRQHCEPPHSTMPLIVVSACALEEDRNQALTHGASFFIPKPFRPKEIVKTIRYLTTSSILNATELV
ncbi:MAG: response regulator [Deltaproteobacteria bacterium]|nr:response regulator [Deltaproteobacteria bacterium]